MLHLPNESLQDTLTFLTSVDKEWQKVHPVFYEFAILCNEAHIGAISVTLLDHDSNIGEIGWIINKDYWNKGYATEAAFAIKDFAKNQLGLKTLIAHCDSNNTASYRIMEKIGMTLESSDGVRRNKNSATYSSESKYTVDL